MDQLRRHMRDGGDAWKTENTHLHWIKRFILFHGKRHPATLSAEHVEQYLNHLANERQCSPATQHIALHALVYLFVRFLAMNLESLEFNKVRQRRRLPVVLTYAEVPCTIQKLPGHSDVKTTEIYTHVLGRDAMGVVSPLDSGR